MLIELGKIKGYNELLKNEISLQKLDRIKLKKNLYDLITPLESLNLIGDLIAKTQTKNLSWKGVEDIITLRIKKLQELAMGIENTSLYPEDILRNSIFLLTKNITLILQAADLGIGDGAPEYIGLSDMGEFIVQNRSNLNQSWIVATCYLTSIDVMINKKRIEFKITHSDKNKEAKISFEQRFSELVEEMKKQDIQLDGILSSMTRTFWDMRTKIVHYGEIPNSKELQLICEYSKEILHMLDSAKPK